MTTVEKSGISRRDILKKGAVAGAVFWSVPVIESITSAAAAASGGAIACSWAYIAYIVNNTIYVAGYSNTGGANNCAAYSANPNHGTLNESTSFGGNSYVFTMNQGSPGGANLVTYTVNGGSSQPGNTPGANNTSPCTTFLVQSGGTITSQGGAVILAYFYFGGNTGLKGGTPSSQTTGNSVTLPSVC